MAKYIAYEVYSGYGDDYVKLHVTSSYDKASELAERDGADIMKHRVDTLSELSDILEEEVNNETASQYLNNTPDESAVHRDDDLADSNSTFDSGDFFDDIHSNEEY